MEKKRISPRWAIIYYIFYFVLFALLVTSFCFELFSGNSIIAFLHTKKDCVSSFLETIPISSVRSILCFFLNFIPEMLLKISLPKLGAPGTIIKTVGICSFFIGWIIKKLDSVEYGIQYTKILEEIWSWHTILFVFHFISALSGLWMAEWGCTEGTYLSCILVIIGIYPQCRILHLFLLNKNRRKEKIKAVWEEKNEFEDILVLSDQITLSNLTEFPDLLKMLLEKFYNYCDDSEKLDKVAYVWERIFALQPNNIDYMNWYKCRIFGDLKSILNNKKSQNLTVLLCGYFLYLCKRRQISEDVLLEVYNSIADDEKLVNYISKEILVDIKIFFAFVAIQSFLSHKIPYNMEFLCIISSIRRSEWNSKYKNECFKECYLQLLRCLDLKRSQDDDETYEKLCIMLPFDEEN